MTAPKLCRIEGCGRPHNSHGLCGTHDRRRLRGTPVDAPIRKQTPGGRRCTADGCDRPGWSASGLCRGHERRRQAGSKLTGPFQKQERLPEFCEHDGCGRRPVALGLCRAHYQQLYTRGYTSELRNSIHGECTYNAAHIRCRTLWGSAKQYPCIECGRPAKQWAYDGTDPNQMFEVRDGSIASVMPYSRHPEFYMPMCGYCHKRRDTEQLRRLLADFREWVMAGRPGVAVA